jgi:hypothetical protein
VLGAGCATIPGNICPAAEERVGRVLAYISLLVPSSWLPTKYLFARLKYFAADPATCEHEWEVVAGILSTIELQVQCRKCIIYGEVPNPSEEEWGAAYGAMENPYPWLDRSRVRQDRFFIHSDSGAKPTESRTLH